MLLVLEAIDQAGHRHKFSCQFDKLEIGLGLLTNIVAQGHSLQSARILDEDSSMDLPLEAFDGEPFLQALQQLEEEWQRILTEPLLPTSSTQQALLEWYQRQTDQYELRIVRYELSLDRLRQLLERANSLKDSFSYKRKLIDHYGSIMKPYEVALIKAHLIRKRLLERRERLLTKPD